MRYLLKPVALVVLALQFWKCRLSSLLMLWDTLGFENLAFLVKARYSKKLVLKNL